MLFYNFGASVSTSLASQAPAQLPVVMETPVLKRPEQWAQDAPQPTVAGSAVSFGDATLWREESR